MNEYRKILTTITVNADLDSVWKAWTTENGAKTFFAPRCNIELQVGGMYEMYFLLNNHPGEQGSEGAVFLAIQPGKMISFTWNSPPHLTEIRKQFTHVIVCFKKISDSETLVELHHDGWGEGSKWDEAYTYFKHAWSKVVLPRLKYSFEVSEIDWNNPPKF